MQLLLFIIIHNSFPIRIRLGLMVNKTVTSTSSLYYCLSFLLFSMVSSSDVFEQGYLKSNSLAPTNQGFIGKHILREDKNIKDNNESLVFLL